MKKQKCPTCGNPIASQASGSITQWISSCSCFLKEQENKQHLLSVTVSICSKCKKRISRNDGSLTQWIFGSNICSCDLPELTKQTIQTYEDRSTLKVAEAEIENPRVDQAQVKKTLSELDIDKDDFPLERFKPLALLGKGAVGIVYLCRDIALDKNVAVKVLQYLDPEQLISFQNEARAASSLKHPNLLEVLNFSTTKSGIPYMELEYFSGVSLSSYLADYGVLDPQLAESIFLQLASALEYAHSKGVYHRDLKPSNILIKILPESVEVKLIDFGVAKAKEHSGFTTTYQDKTLAGTPAYTAPDPAAGVEYDACSEIYSLGCVIYESLVGSPPFEASTALEILAMHAKQKPPAVTDSENLNNQIAWSEIVATCLAKEKEERFQSMQDLHEAISSIDNGSPDILSTLPDENQDTEIQEADLGDVSEKSVIEKKKPGSKKPFLIAVGILILLVGTTTVLAYERIEALILTVQNDGEAYLRKAESLTKGKARNWEKAAFWYEKGLEKKEDRKVEFDLAKIYQTKTDQPEKSIKWFIKSAKSDYGPAQLSLGNVYFLGVGVRKDYDEAVYWYRKAIEHKDPEALYMLANCYEDGYGVYKDLEKAFQLYKRSASKDYVKAHFKLAQFYREGIGTKEDDKKAFEIYEKLAKRGIPKGIFRLGDRYQRGLGVRADRRKAVELFKKAADLNDASAMCRLGQCYARGSGVPKDNVMAFSLYKRAAEHGSRSAKGKLVRCYQKGEGVKKDLQKAIYWAEKAAAEGSSYAMRLLGNIYLFDTDNKSDFPKAVKWYRKAAAKGDKSAVFELGWCYESGKGVEKDYGKALEWYRKSAASGYCWGERNLGSCYYYGKGVEKDYKEAFKWYQKAAAHQTDGSSMSRLAGCYYKGLGTKKNYKKASSWYQKASEKGHTNSTNWMGILYYRGHGVKQDRKKAFEYFKRAAEKGNDIACSNTALCYQNGLGTAKNMKLANHWYRRAIKEGNVDSMTNLGHKYLNGDGVPKDYDRALFLFRKAAAKGEKTAQLNIGVCYEHGWGVKKDKNKAFKIYKDVAEQGLPRGLFNLGICYENGIGVKKDLHKALELYEKALAKGEDEAKADVVNLRKKLKIKKL